MSGFLPGSVSSSAIPRRPSGRAESSCGLAAPAERNGGRLVEPASAMLAPAVRIRRREIICFPSPYGSFGIRIVSAYGRFVDEGSSEVADTHYDQGLPDPDHDAVNRVAAIATRIP